MLKNSANDMGSTAQEIARLTAQLEERTLRLEEVSARLEAMEALLDEQEAATENLQAENDSLNDRIDELKMCNDDLHLSLAQSEEDRIDAYAYKAQLEKFYATPRNQEPVGIDIDSIPTPSSVVEIIEILKDTDTYGELTKYIVLTDAEKALANAAILDQKDHLDIYAQNLWETVVVLHDYVKECVEYGFQGNLHMYLLDKGVHGRQLAPNRHKANESETVRSNPKRRRERTFPVPKEVDAAEEKFMTTHFDLGTKDSNAPRMYYHADVHTTGKAYIGYIGLHLNNTMTN
ncbi:hypothetical protein I6H48_03590 [Corynebacterium amycolatum]|uniref:Uncharacterized protein n=1 Tax=Corynebacterium amycolatum TaxID=43765 RepID=A0AB37GDG1_CORAY|nr:hypothetical protein [Corynebacterium amycolatum]QPR31439.1 hypothetical protein I6G95_03010 [Corynebacterium amycolatum]QQB83317.1 hypothetical protein I6H48_03590 [Corynebacterium amycolatum]